MVWTIELTGSARRQLSKLDSEVARRIVHFLRQRIAPAEDPRALGKALQGPLSGIWAYRVGDYRLLCTIEDRIVTIVVVEIEHRSRVYR